MFAMMRSPRRGLRLFAAWAAASALVSSAAWQVVGAAEDQVSEKPLSRLIAIPSPTTSPVPAPLAPASSSSTTTVPDPPPTPPEIVAPTVTTPSTTSTTVAPQDEPWTTEAVATPAGVVLVSYRPGEVRLEAVTPIPGWSYKVTKAEPDEVEVRFSGRRHAAVVASARWVNGTLDTEVDSD